jgi:hypothetical protein
MGEKFAAKFAEAGNLKLQDVSRFLTSSLGAAALTSIVFHSIFPAGLRAWAIQITRLRRQFMIFPERFFGLSSYSQA